MNIIWKKLTKPIAVSLAVLPLLIATNLSAAEETMDQRIQKLEALIMELKSQVSEQKTTHETQMKKQEVAAAPAAPEKEKHSYSFGGFIKTTASFNKYSAGDIGAGSALRDFYIPASIPVSSTSGGGEQDFDFGAKESRINFKSKHELDNGETVSTLIEMDFLLPGQGDERISNSYSPRIRHAFFTYGKWLFGQTWTTFQDVGALPESTDFLGASEGIIFGRQPQLRYTNGPWQFALENPESTVTPFGGGARIVTDDNRMPDFIARYNHTANWGHITVAALLRQLAYDNGSTIDDTISSTGISITGKFKVGDKDDIRFNFATGSLGRYAALDTSNGAVLNASGGLEAIDSTVGSIAYRHVWNSQWRSNFIYSAIDVDNDTSLTGMSVTKEVSSFQANIHFSPDPKITLGVGILDATRKLESGADGDLTRLMFTAKYAF